MDDGAEDKVLLVFRYTGGVSAVSVEDWALKATQSNPAAQTANANGQTSPLIVFGVCGMMGTGTPEFNGSTTPAFDAEIATSDSDLLVRYKIYNSSPVDHTVDMDDLGSHLILGSGYIEIS